MEKQNENFITKGMGLGLIGITGLTLLGVLFAAYNIWQLREPVIVLDPPPVQVCFESNIMHSVQTLTVENAKVMVRNYWTYAEKYTPVNMNPKGYNMSTSVSYLYAIANIKYDDFANVRGLRMYYAFKDDKKYVALFPIGSNGQIIPTDQLRYGGEEINPDHIHVLPLPENFVENGVCPELCDF